MEFKPLVVFIVGPTASGKTNLAIELAKILNGEIISADSMQIYKYMDIGTAKPTNEEMDGIKHHLLDIITPSQEYSVALFQRDAMKAIFEITKKNKLPIVAGGTGLYIDSLVKPLDFSKGEVNWDYRNKLNELVEKYGKEYIHRLLKHKDPPSYFKLYPNDTKRIIRALEVYRDTGKPISLIQSISKRKEILINPILIGLTLDRELLYQRINQRVDIMIEKGLIEEVKNLQKMGFTRGLVSMEGLGYKEIIKYLDGEYTLREALDILKRDTRRFAKRQLTWFRRYSDIYWYDVGRSSIKELLEKTSIFINNCQDPFEYK